MSAVFPRIGWFLCEEHPETKVFHKSNRCPFCVELDERAEKMFNASAEAEEREAKSETN